MAVKPYLLKLNVVLAASASGTMSYQVSPTEKLTLKDLMFTSTGAFSLTNIRDNTGFAYTNASSNNAIPSTMLRNIANQNNTLQMLPMPLVIEKGQTIYFDVTDTSAAPNTVQFLISAERDLGQS